jgi:hypothetical protein
MAYAEEYKNVVSGGLAHNHRTPVAVHGVGGGGDAEVCARPSVIEGEGRPAKTMGANDAVANYHSGSIAGALQSRRCA